MKLNIEMAVLRHQSLCYRRPFSRVQLRIISSTLKGYSIRSIELSHIRYASAGLIHERAKQINAVNETENRAACTRHTPLKRNEFRFRALSYSLLTLVSHFKETILAYVVVGM